jgi:hypothetical protein
MTDRDKRALRWLAIVAPAILLIYWVTTPPAPPVVVTSARAESTADAEARIDRMRQSVARVPGKTEVLNRASAELTEREKGLIVAETANLAQEQVLQILRRVAAAQAPPVEVRSVELSAPRAFGNAYGEVTIAAAFECRIDQLVQMLADLSARPELVSTSDLRMTAANPKQKTIQVRMAVSGIVPKRLVPQKKEGML